MRTIAITLLFVAGLGTVAGPAKADTTEPAPGGPAAATDPEPPTATEPPAPPTPSQQRRSDRRRVVHAIAVVGFGAAYLVSELAVKDQLAPAECAWCNPPGFDVSVRDALKWDNTNRADTISTITGYIVPPLSAISLLLASTWRERSWRRLFDDAVPMLEAAVSVGLINQAAKFIVGRQRPFVHFAEPGRPPELDDNMSFFSGHTTLAFSEAVAAGVVAHRRGYALEPVIWATGLTLAAATGYLRMAADRHYLSDVLVGAVVGSGIGLLVPLIFHSDVLGKNIELIPKKDGLAIIGTF
jgi:membrane-associated phospholipid phosphatase